MSAGRRPKVPPRASVLACGSEQPWPRRRPGVARIWPVAVAIILCGVLIVLASSLPVEAAHGCGDPARHVVDPTADGACHYATVQAAVDAAAAGETVTVQGEHSENVVINTSELVLTADSDATITAVSGDDPTVTIRAPGVEIRGTERLTLTGGAAGIEVDEVRDVTIREVTLEGNERGIRLRSSSETTVAETHIAENTREGIAFTTTTDSEIHGNVIRNNEGSGIDVRRSEAILIVENRVIGNDQEGVFLWESTNTTVENNSVDEQGESGILLTQSTGNTLSGNELRENEGTGLAVYGSSDNEIRGGSIAGSDGDGVFFRESADTRLVGTTVTGHGSSGVKLRDSSNIEFQGNEITENTADGVTFRDASGTLTENTIARNDRGISVLDASRADVSDNEITANRVGVFVEAPATPDVTVTTNNITQHAEYGIAVWHDRWEIAGEQHSITNVDAAENWWGHASGPYHPNQNDDGQGDRVSGNVDFEPWLNEAGEPVGAGLAGFGPLVAVAALLIGAAARGSVTR